MSDVDSTPDLIALYEEVALMTARMLSAAQQRDWDQLSQLEHSCASCIERLSGCATAPTLSGEIRRQKISLLRRILDNDRETRELTEPWMRSIARVTSQSAGCHRLDLPGTE